MLILTKLYCKANPVGKSRFVRRRNIHCDDGWPACQNGLVGHWLDKGRWDSALVQLILRLEEEQMVF